MWGLRSTRTLVIAAAIVTFVGCSVLPLASMLAGTFSGRTGVGSSYAAFLLDPRQSRLLFNTALLGTMTAVLATVIGAPLGVALARLELRGKAIVRVLLSAPMLLPPFVVGLAWISLGGDAGVLAQLAGRDVLSTWTYSMSGAVLVLTLVLYPVSMLATEAAVRRIEPSLEEAALIVARPRRVVWHITLRLAAPSIAAAALVIFVLAISEFGVPGLLRVRVYTTEVFTAFAAIYDFSRGAVLALPLLLTSTVIAAIAVAMAGEHLIATRRAMTDGHPSLFDAWKPAAVAAASGMVLLALILPLLVMVREAHGVRSWVAVVAGSSAAIRNSLLLAAVGATLTLGVGLCLGYARARARRPVGVMADLACVVLFAVPSTVVGVGLIGLWNRRGVLGTVYGTDAMLVLVCLARFLPVAALGIAAAVRQVPYSHEEAAATAGAGWTRTITQIVVPQVSSSLAAVWVVVFVLAFGELGASILVAPPGEATLPIRIYTMIANAPPANVAALGLLQSLVILSPLMLLAWGLALREAR
jgi:iron(III) transport system permease protein